MLSFDIILPSINRDSLQLAVDSVIAQTYQDWNLYVVIDGIDRLGLDLAFSNNDDDRIRRFAFLDKHNDSGAEARNAAVERGDGQWIAYIDDDDLWRPYHLAMMAKEIEERPDINMVRMAGQSFMMKHKHPRSSERVLKPGPVNTLDILTVGMAHTREIFEETDGWLPCDNHDLVLWKQMLAAGGNAVESNTVTFDFKR